ncbi:MAG: hypothetical protein M3N54_08575, partial [Acidobacteriota bacterium]|nr:hypothetical protein [Acidobacteriota bacterium]
PTPAPYAPSQKLPIRPASRPTVRVTQSGLRQISKESHPDLKPKIVDPSSVDPTLHLSLLAKLQDVKVEGSPRSLFEVSDHAPTATLAMKEPPKIPITPAFVGPKPPPPPPGPPPVPEAPRIALKFYGFVNPSKPGNKRAFFLDGEEIVVASEGDLIKKRYKIVRIGVNSAVVEDTTFKGNNTQQTLPLEAEMQG